MLVLRARRDAACSRDVITDCFRRETLPFESIAARSFCYNMSFVQIVADAESFAHALRREFEPGSTITCTAIPSVLALGPVRSTERAREDWKSMTSRLLILEPCRGRRGENAAHPAAQGSGLRGDRFFFVPQEEAVTTTHTPVFLLFDL